MFLTGVRSYVTPGAAFRVIGVLFALLLGLARYYAAEAPEPPAIRYVIGHRRHAILGAEDLYYAQSYTRDEDSIEFTCDQGDVHVLIGGQFRIRSIKTPGRP